VKEEHDDTKRYKARLVEGISIAERYKFYREFLSCCGANYG